MSKLMTKISNTMGHMAPQAITASEVSAVAFAIGVAKGKYGSDTIKVWKIPGDLLAGIGLHVLAFSGMVGKAAPAHMHAMANGALAAYMVGLGQKLGKKL